MVPNMTELRDPEKEDWPTNPEKPVQPSDVTRSVTQNTATSNLTNESRSPQSTNHRSWYHRLNPLKSRKAIPVPEERVVSREYGANLLSLLTFQWMYPVMKVTSCVKCRDGFTLLTFTPGWVSKTVGTQ